MDIQGPEVSVVVPLLNEQDNIGPLYEQITQTLTDEYDYEIIFVDDGSSDNSFNVLTKLQKADARMRVICFRKNFGQTAALSAGFAHARGKVIVAIDADLSWLVTRSFHPAAVPLEYQVVASGYDARNFKTDSDRS